jgi:hypothetical protein
MTVVACWIRRIRDAEELVFASDSRLSGDGRNFDSCPKILTLPRTDCAIAFAGYTGHAFPLMLQLGLAIAAYEPARRGGLDVSSLRKHALKVFDRMAQEIKSSSRMSIEQSVAPEASFLFGGYSWIKKKFEIWSIAYEVSEGKFVARPGSSIRFHPEARKFVFSNRTTSKNAATVARVVFAGDQAAEARARLRRLLDDRRDKMSDFMGLNWEPFEVIRDMLRDPNHSETIGGAPQVVKVYQYFQTAPLAVYWPDKASSAVVLQGRPCLGYERIDRWILDPDSLISYNDAFSTGGEEEPGLNQEI